MGAPAFGRGQVAYAVIDSRQAYLQEVVRRAFVALGYTAEAAGLRHFSYEMVGLSPRCAEDLGFRLSEEDRSKSYIEVSGRKGLGIKADDLIDALTRKAIEEVQSRGAQSGAEEQDAARMIAVSALRYFLAKYTRRTLIAFDFAEALAFEGETGPYLQYTVVRARNIFRKFSETHPGEQPPERLASALTRDTLRTFLGGEGGVEFWELILASAQLETTVDQAIASEEPATLAKYAFRLAQGFNNFYHHHHILHERNCSLQALLLFVASIVSNTLAQTLDLLGIEIPEQM